MDEVVIDGVRYVPAVNAAPMISEVLRVLAGLLRDPEEIDTRDYRHLRIHVREVDSLSEDDPSGITFDEFAAKLAELMAHRMEAMASQRQPTGSEVVLRALSPRENRVARLAGLASQATRMAIAEEDVAGYRPSELDLAREKLAQAQTGHCLDELRRLSGPIT